MTYLLNRHYMDSFYLDFPFLFWHSALTEELRN